MKGLLEEISERDADVKVLDQIFDGKIGDTITIKGSQWKLVGWLKLTYDATIGEISSWDGEIPNFVKEEVIKRQGEDYWKAFFGEVKLVEGNPENYLLETSSYDGGTWYEWEFCILERK